MKHHFSDHLDRADDYWTITPNNERFCFIADYKIENKDDVKVLTIRKDQNKEHWEQIFDCSNLEELTLHNPSKEQVQAIQNLKTIKIGMASFNTKEYAFIQAALPSAGVNFGHRPWTACYKINADYMEFIGRGVKRVKLNNPKANEKIEEFEAQYAQYIKEGENIIKKLNTSS